MLVREEYFSKTQGRTHMHLENKYFSWEDWDGDMWDSLTFTNCTLQRDMGNFKKGDHIKVISMSYQEGWIEFYDEDSVIATFKFEISLC